MATITIANPQKVKIAATSAIPQTFIPYRENFTTKVTQGVSIEFNAETAGQAFYYLKQATEGLAVEQINEFDAASETNIVVEVPAKITITNTSTVEKVFMPYRENFTVSIAAGDTIELTATTLGQVLYYLAQATEGLTVTQVKVSA